MVQNPLGGNVFANAQISQLLNRRIEQRAGEGKIEPDREQVDLFAVGVRLQLLDLLIGNRPHLVGTVDGDLDRVQPLAQVGPTQRNRHARVRHALHQFIGSGLGIGQHRVAHHGGGTTHNGRRAARGDQRGGAQQQFGRADEIAVRVIGAAHIHGEQQPPRIQQRAGTQHRHRHHLNGRGAQGCALGTILAPVKRGNRDLSLIQSGLEAIARHRQHQLRFFRAPEAARRQAGATAHRHDLRGDADVTIIACAILQPVGRFRPYLGRVHVREEEGAGVRAGRQQQRQGTEQGNSGRSGGLWHRRRVR